MDEQEGVERQTDRRMGGLTGKWMNGLESRWVDVCKCGWLSRRYTVP